MRCILVGTGSIGQRHARALRVLMPDIEIIALRSGHGGSLLPDMVHRQIYDRQEALSLHPDCVIVANPAPFHPPSAAPFISAGIPVLVEKPIAVDATGAQALLTAARDNPHVLVGYVLRHDAGLNRFREALNEGTIGRLITLHLEAGQVLSDWRPGTDPARSISARRDTGGGVIFELSHEIDSAHWLLGEIDVVHALAGNRGDLPLDVEDTALVTLRSADGALVLVQIDMSRKTALRCYRAVGTAGTLTWNAGNGSVRLEQPNHTRVLFESPPDRDVLFQRQMTHFLSVVRGEVQPLCSLEDGVKALTAILGARRAAGLDTEIAA